MKPVSRTIKPLPRPKEKSLSTSAKAPVVNEILQKAFIDFILYCPARRFSRNLRNMLLKYLVLSEAKEPGTKELLVDLESLFRLLEVVEEERPEWLME